MLKKITILILLAITVYSCNNKDLSSLKQDSPLKISGKLTQVGNEPFSQYAIVSSKYNYTLPLIIRHIETENELAKKMGKKVTLLGTLHIETKTTVSKQKSIQFYYLVVDTIK